MADFSDGVKGYINTSAIVHVAFPIDWRGNADVSCNQCPYFGRNSKTCQLTKSVVHYPEKYIGYDCPLTADEENNKEDKNE